jgi:hypothetical protein
MGRWMASVRSARARMLPLALLAIMALAESAGRRWG